MGKKGNKVYKVMLTSGGMDGDNHADVYKVFAMYQNFSGFGLINKDQKINFISIPEDVYKGIRFRFIFKEGLCEFQNRVVKDDDSELVLCLDMGDFFSYLKENIGLVKTQQKYLISQVNELSDKLIYLESIAGLDAVGKDDELESLD